VSSLNDSIHRPLTDLDVLTEANRCLFCYDAPCTTACPTHIDVPAFIRKITTDNLAGSARTIMDANPMGASCARVCPTEYLCEGACVYAHAGVPIRIGDLQRYVTDWAREHKLRFFEPGAPTGKQVAIIGAGPAGLSAARELRRFGHAVTIFETHERAGGLNTYGIVPFRLELDVALWEAQQVLDMGVTLRPGDAIAAAGLLEEFDAVILACGMGSVPKLGIPGEELNGVLDALDFIERAKLQGRVPELGDEVIVIGGGNTAIDALTCAKRLGAKSVTMFYRRGESDMSAYPFEYEFAKQEGIEFRWHCMPKRILGENGRVRGVEFVRTQQPANVVGANSFAPRNRGASRTLPAEIPGSEFIERADTVIRAIGQSRLRKLFDELGVQHENEVVKVDDKLETSRRGMFAAGDCIFAKGGREAMVVEAAEQGKIAARSVHAALESSHG
jgi:dihydropyrimidine dehydrogenase (NAD+) subunit PreT